MRPDELKNGQGGALDPVSLPQQAAAQIVRAQIDNIYENKTEPDALQKPLESTNPYLRTHIPQSHPQAEQWEKYHTAWQNYYQKYYEGYYSQHVKKSVNAENSDNNYFGNQNTIPNESDMEYSKDEAIFDLHQKLLGKVQESATKVKKSRHFWPIMSGVAVVFILLFLQYNRILVSNVMAYVSPGNIDPQNIIVDPSGTVVVSAESRLIIPKINVDVPIIFDIGSDYNSQMAAMANGVAHFAIPGASSHPGQVGNTVIAGHSSNDLFDTGDYKFIFVQLDKLIEGDTVYINYQKIRYTYIVTKKEVVKPEEVNKLVYETSIPMLTLLTCTPIGTATSRLLVSAKQVSPDPSTSIAAPTKENDNKLSSSSIPGNSPTFFEWLFSSKY